MDPPDQMAQTRADPGAVPDEVITGEPDEKPKLSGLVPAVVRTGTPDAFFTRWKASSRTPFPLG